MKKMRWLGVLLGAIIILLVGVSGAFAWQDDVKVTPPTMEFGLYDFLREAVIVTAIPRYEYANSEISDEAWKNLRYRIGVKFPRKGFSLRIKPSGARINKISNGGSTYKLEILFGYAGTSGRDVIVPQKTFKVKGRLVIIPVRVKIVKYCGEEEATRDLEKVLSTVKHNQKLLIRDAKIWAYRNFGDKDLVERYDDKKYYWLKYDRELVITFELIGGDEISVIEEETK